MAALAAPSSPAITYTNKPAFTNAAGQTCREYKSTDATGGHPIDVFGTACKAADGQWRVVN
jgi:surface antigen